jgi:hypothetical protein
MAKQVSQPHITHLAQTIVLSVAQLQKVLENHKAPFPSFDRDGPLSLPKEASNAQNAILDAAGELYDLLLEPVASLLIHSAV